jgi:Leucine-rich repeat (LRR) protein
MRCEFISATAAATVSKKAGGGKTSASLKRSQLSICKICWCSKELDLIDCNTEHVLVKQLERHLGSSRNLTINSTHFDNLRERVESIYIDFDSYNINLRIDHNALHKLGNLRQLTLVKVSELNKMLNLKHSPHLKHLRISDSGVKELSTEFCSSMHHLETVDFSRNEITDIRFVFDGCAELNVLDLSYNRIVSLDRAFNDKSSKINTLNFGNNKIERIDEHDLAALEDLVDLDLANNLIESVHENAFDRLTQLVKLDLTNNNLVSLPAHSAVYMSLKVLYVNENSRMLHFPDASQFSSIEELKVHYSYHCCQFLKKQTQRLAQTPEVKIIKFAHR